MSAQKEIDMSNKEITKIIENDADTVIRINDATHSMSDVECQVFFMIASAHEYLIDPRNKEEFSSSLKDGNQKLAMYCTVKHSDTVMNELANAFKRLIYGFVNAKTCNESDGTPLTQIFEISAQRKGDI